MALSDKLRQVIRQIFFQFFYLQKPPWDTGISPPELMEFIAQTPPGRGLDLGCGTGTNAITLAQHGWEMTGIDFVGRAIKTARRKAAQADLAIDFRTGDVTNLADVPGPFDLMLDIGCFHSLTEEGKTAYVKNLENLLAPEGLFLMYAFFREPDEPANRLGGGLLEEDLELLDNKLHLERRQDGNDRGRRLSAWFWYRK